VEIYVREKGEIGIGIFSWRRDLFQWEEDCVAQLRELLEPLTLSTKVDSWCWIPDPEGCYL
jgi:hypothetical protein